MADKKDVEIQSAGNIRISEEVVAIVADKAIKDVEGISGLMGGFASNIAAALGKKSAPRGIDVEIKENDVVITLHASVKYGARIPDVAWKAQEAVKAEVSNITGLNVVKVNINIEGVEIGKAEAPAKEKVTINEGDVVGKDTDDTLMAE